MVAIENLEGSSPNGDNEAPKEWARLELQLALQLRDDWPAFAQKLRARYSNRTTKHSRIQQRQALKQDTRSFQEYKQRFEYLCKETNFPQQVWGEEFFKGLIEPLQGKLLGTPFVDITNYDVVTELALQYECGYHMQKHLKSPSGSAKPSYQKPAAFEPKGDTHASSFHPHLTRAGKLSQEVKDYRKKHNLCMFDGGNHPTHQCQRLIEKLAKEGKPPPAPPASPSFKVSYPTPSKNTPLTIASLNNGKSVELKGKIGGVKANFLVDGAAQANACTYNVMNANPNRKIKSTSKNICSFDGNVALPANLAYEATLNTNLPGLFDGDIGFVEAPISSHDAILGLPWLESVNPDINWITKCHSVRT
ncbi:hypothetical protein K3495_g7866 [Podosphaera aphanis]|nr:hypothetical protein K3495_g7866 [Podosphaera aphanis]